MSLLEEIYNGWKNYLFPNLQIEELAKKRAVICVNCPKLKSNKVCSICGCYIPAKVRSPRSKCPIKKW
jgi:hypothetical protein